MKQSKLSRKISRFAFTAGVMTIGIAISSAASAQTMVTTEMDHSQMDHSQMPAADMESMPMDHSAGHSGEGSGTARLPANEAMLHGAMADLGGDASLMLHGYVWGVHTNQTGPRGGNKTYAQSMAMATLTKPFAGGKFTARTMLSAEPMMSARGYPNLFATGETAQGQPLVDGQHPHDLFMELAGRLDVDVAEGTTMFVYGGPVGEPSLGPSAFMHRASARYNPEAPITHHWFDSTHITYGVVTGGVAAKHFQLEASAFRGREPDEARWNIESPKLDSWSIRASVMPDPSLMFQASYGELASPETSHPGEDERRFTVSAHYNNAAGLSGMAAFSSKRSVDHGVAASPLTAFLAELNWNLDRHHTVFGRFENVANGELFPAESDPLHGQIFRVSKFQAGYAYRLPLGPAQLALGGTVAAFAKPDVLDSHYGSNPMGYTVFVRLSLGE